MYRVDRNNFYRAQKDATVYTPPAVSQFLFNIVHKRINPSGVVVDPCVGTGSLLHPFRRADFSTQGIDIVDQGYPGTIVRDFISIEAGEISLSPSLVIANPPFNVYGKTGGAIKSFGPRPLLPEVWLDKIITLWDTGVPIVLFAPYGLRLNQTARSRRWRKFTAGYYPEIASIVSLPKDIYESVLFHSEVLIFNIGGLKGHYFFSDSS